MTMLIKNKRGQIVEVFSFTADDYAFIGPPGDPGRGILVPFGELKENPRKKAWRTGIWPRFMLA